MFRSLEDFGREWAHEREATLRLLDRLTDTALHAHAVSDGRTLQQIAWHLVLTLREMGARVGLERDATQEGSRPPDSAAEIAAAYRLESRQLSEMIMGRWNDAELQAPVDMYGEEWQKGFVLSALIRHQAHHRGQMTVLMRIAGLTVPGLYGPSREEWAGLGMEAPW